MDTLIVIENGIYKIERYKGQDLDLYYHIAELNHDELCTYKQNNYYFMKTITYDDIFNYLFKEFGFKG